MATEYTQAEEDAFGVDELKTVSDGGLRIMRSHLQESAERIRKAAGRDDEINLDNVMTDPGAPSSNLGNAEACLYHTIEAIEDELDGRGADYE